MGKINQPDNTVNHGIAKGDECINRSPGQTAKKELNKIIHNFPNNSKRRAWNRLFLFQA
jgi:hypothetical protein